MDELQLTGRSLRWVFNLRNGRVHPMPFLCYGVKTPNSMLKTKPKQLVVRYSPIRYRAPRLRYISNKSLTLWLQKNQARSVYLPKTMACMNGAISAGSFNASPIIFSTFLMIVNFWLPDNGYSMVVTAEVCKKRGSLSMASINVN